MAFVPLPKDDQIHLRCSLAFNPVTSQSLAVKARLLSVVTMQASGRNTKNYSLAHHFILLFDFCTYLINNSMDMK